jgi:hypothetical protein
MMCRFGRREKSWSEGSAWAAKAVVGSFAFAGPKAVRRGLVSYQGGLQWRGVRYDFANASLSVFEELRMLRILGRKARVYHRFFDQGNSALTSSGEGITSILLDVSIVWVTRSRIWGMQVPRLEGFLELFEGVVLVFTRRGRRENLGGGFPRQARFVPLVGFSRPFPCPENRSLGGQFVSISMCIR